VFAGAEHTRYAHSISVGVLARRFGKELSQRLLLDEAEAAGRDVVSSQHDLQRFTAEECRATKQELLQLELAGFAHDLGHGPFSHLWEKYLRSVDGSQHWCGAAHGPLGSSVAFPVQDTSLCYRSHESMSERLLDLAVQEVVAEFQLPADHFLQNPDNIRAVKCMIQGDTSNVPAAKRWLYTIVCNEQSGAFMVNYGSRFGAVLASTLACSDRPQRTMLPRFGLQHTSRIAACVQCHSQGYVVVQQMSTGPTSVTECELQASFLHLIAQAFRSQQSEK
jgi:hypothetical protein